MREIFRRLTVLVALLSLPATAAAQASKPLRHLTYTFTWGASTDLQMQNSGMTGNGGTNGSGMNDFNGGTQDKGTISVDVLHEQPDRGLVVEIAEQAQGQRSAAPVNCVVFGNTNVMCAATGKVTPEEMSLLRLLGPTFIDSTQIDPKQHWREQQNAPGFSTVSDFTIAQNNGGVMKIVESRTITSSGSSPFTRSIAATIAYDSNKLVPTSIVEDSIERSQAANQYQVVKSQTSLQLRTDSMAAQP